MYLNLRLSGLNLYFFCLHIIQWSYSRGVAVLRLTRYTWLFYTVFLSPRVQWSGSRGDQRVAADRVYLNLRLSGLNLYFSVCTESSIELQPWWYNATVNAVRLVILYTFVSPRM